MDPPEASHLILDNWRAGTGGRVKDRRQGQGQEMRKLEKEEQCAGGPRTLKREPTWRGGARAPFHAGQQGSLKPNKAGCASFISGVAY